jgi:hypothetical protein
LDENEIAYRKILNRVGKMRPEDGGCWVYVGGVNAAGYGRIRVGKRVDYTHRVVARHHFGNAVDGLTVDHLCFHRACCNPRHLSLCTKNENAWRAKSDAWRALVAGLVAYRNAKDDGIPL